MDTGGCLRNKEYRLEYVEYFNMNIAITVITVKSFKVGYGL